MTLVNDRRDADEGVTLPGASTETVNDPIGSAEPDGGRPGPELDEARTAPVAIIPTASTSAGPSSAPSDSAFRLQNLLRAGLVTPAVNGLAVLGLLAGVVLHAPLVGLVVVAVAVVAPLATPGNLAGLKAGLGPTGVNPFPRILLAVLTALVVAPPAAAVAVAALFAGAGLLEPVASRINTAAGPYAANVPGIAVRNDGLLAVRVLFLINAPAALLAALAAPLGLWPVSLGLGVVALCATLLCGGDAAARVVARRRAEHRIAGAIADLRPAFALHWDAPPGTEYQVTMWLPYLERIGTPFVIVVRNPKAFDGIAAVTDAPVVVRPQPRDLDAVVAPSLRAVFYVNNAARNTHLIRFTGLVHVQLNHGESDKAPSYSPVFRLYDRDFVAGQAAIDRFARNGVHMPADLFRIVGRPQIEQILVGGSTTEVKTALYAPTWGGSNADSDYCSLPIGVAIVESLLRRGYTVVFRPHPYTDKDPNHAREAARIVDLLAADARTTGRAHRFGAASGRAMSITDCFNAADVMVSDVSSVVPDFLYSEKPFAIAAMQGSVHAFKQSFPIAEAGYVLDRKGRNIDHVLDAMTGADPIREARKASKRYFLGEFPAESYADGFLDAAREVVLPPRR